MYDFYCGEILLFDKPIHWSSFDIVNKVRIEIKKKYGKKLKVGHAGTLDPLASGLLILCTGKMTKQIENFQHLDKEYQAVIKFGATTPSFDLETQPDNFFEIKHINLDLLNETLNNFIGIQMQRPPNFSAKKINGETAYVNARLGKDFEIKKNEIEIKKIEIIEHNLPEQVTIRMTVSKGTYIRSFANDLGIKLNSGAYLQKLIRTKIGDYNVQNALSIEDFIENLKNIDTTHNSINN